MLAKGYDLAPPEPSCEDNSNTEVCFVFHNTEGFVCLKK